MDCDLPEVTKVPRPEEDSTSPFSESVLTASRTAVRLTPNCCARSRSPGNCAPGFILPSRIDSSICSTICSNSRAVRTVWNMLMDTSHDEPAERLARIGSLYRIPWVVVRRANSSHRLVDRPPDLNTTGLLVIPLVHYSCNMNTAFASVQVTSRPKQT